MDAIDYTTGKVVSLFISFHNSVAARSISDDGRIDDGLVGKLRWTALRSSPLSSYRRRSPLTQATKGESNELEEKVVFYIRGEEKKENKQKKTEKWGENGGRPSFSLSRVQPVGFLLLTAEKWSCLIGSPIFLSSLIYC